MIRETVGYKSKLFARAGLVEIPRYLWRLFVWLTPAKLAERSLTHVESCYFAFAFTLLGPLS